MQSLLHYYSQSFMLTNESIIIAYTDYLHNYICSSVLINTGGYCYESINV